KVNQYDSQALREKLSSEGWEFSASMEDADTVFINTCTVTAEADRQCRQLVRRVLKKNADAPVVITGCYAKRAAGELRELSPRVEIPLPAQGLPERAEDRPITFFEGHSRAFMKIQDGCDAYCSYCVVPLVRPVMWSRPEDTIVSELRQLAGSGYSEIVLPGLLETIAAMPGDFRVRLSSLEVTEVEGELVSLMRAYPERLCPHLHLPLQSGSDDILKRMNRPYRSGDFSAVMGKLVDAVPDISLSTDVIAGFPGETEADFARTYDFLKSSGFSRLHVFTFSPRPGTAAAAYTDRIPGAVAQERSHALRALDSDLQEAFWRRFAGRTRRAVSEGKKETLLTDNYIRLTAGEEIKNDTNNNKIFDVRIVERDGRPWGKKIHL
ncbi:MAG: MiaB/RimO family radical SAM methylthiotransferase, partial [Endomicrobiales bacterium]